MARFRIAGRMMISWSREVEVSDDDPQATTKAHDVARHVGAQAAGALYETCDVEWGESAIATVLRIERQPKEPKT